MFQNSSSGVENKMMNLRMSRWITPGSDSERTFLVACVRQRKRCRLLIAAEATLSITSNFEWRAVLNFSISYPRANAQLSTGPNTETGKAKSSLNAVKTGLTGCTVLPASDDAAVYEAHVSEVTARYAPSTEEERALVQSIADAEWRLMRIPTLEMGIYAVGRLEFAQLFSNEQDAVRNQLIEAKIFLTYQRQLNNLSIQESRLRRQREKDLAALRRLQEERTRKVEASVGQPAGQYIQLVRENCQSGPDAEQLGFEFSSSQSELQALGIHRNLFALEQRKLADVA